MSKMAVFFLGTGSVPGMGSTLRSKGYAEVRNDPDGFRLYPRKHSVSAAMRSRLLEKFSSFMVRGPKTRTRYKADGFFGVFEVSVSGRSANVEISHGATIPMNGADRKVLYSQAMTHLRSTGWPAEKAEFKSPYEGKPFRPRKKPRRDRLAAARRGDKELPALK